MPQGIAYNPSTHNLINSPKTANQINLVQNIQTPTYSEDKYVALGKEIKGGHYVEYLSQLLIDDKYAGVFLSRREKGMLVSVHYNDDGSPCNKVYQLINYPGTNTLDDWQQIGGVDIDVFNRIKVSTLAERDTLIDGEKDVCFVEDARQQVEIDNGDPIYSATYMWNGSNWLIVKTPGSIDVSEVRLNTSYRHARNTDTHLDYGGNNPISAAAIVDHLSNKQVHIEINDEADKDVENATYSAKKIYEVAELVASSISKKTSSIHNDLKDIQGGNALERYHLSKDQYDGIAKLLYAAPEISISPSSLGVHEVGKIIDIDQFFQLNYKNAENIEGAEVDINGIKYPLPYSSHRFHKELEYPNSGTFIPFTAKVFRTDNQAAVTVSPSITMKYRAFWLISDEDLISTSNEEITEYLKNKAQSSLVSSKALGLKTFTNTSGRMANIYIAVPKSMGVPTIASSAFPDSPGKTYQHKFLYTNANTVTEYYLVKMADMIGAGGSYKSIIK